MITQQEFVDYKLSQTACNEVILQTANVMLVR
jgi:hypothetical protein